MTNLLPISQDQKGLKFHFLREPHLAQDDSHIVDAVLNVLEKLINFDFILLLQPTSPLRTKEDITNIIKLQKQYNASSLVSVCEAKENPALFYEINNDNYLSKSFKQYKGSNRQEYKRNYIINGALYLSSVENLKNNKSFITNKTIPYVMPRERSIDIDDITDIRWGEFIQKYKNQ